MLVLTSSLAGCGFEAHLALFLLLAVFTFSAMLRFDMTLYSCAQISEDKFRKALLGLKLGYSDENTATLVRHYDFDHVGKVYYREFCKDVRHGCFVVRALLVHSVVLRPLLSPLSVCCLVTCFASYVTASSEIMLCSDGPICGRGY